MYECINNQLHKNQFGFRKKRSATAQMLIYLDSIYKLNNEKSTSNLATLYTDFSKAFDKVPHQILIEKLKLRRIGGKLLDLVKSYLSEKKQFLVVNEASSSERHGVPQGSILGPLLFLVFANDLPENMKELECFAFAADFKVIVKRQDEINLSTNILSKWCEENQMSMNAKKCSIIDFRGSSTGSLNDIEISHPDSARDFGVIISKTLSWEENSTSRRQKALAALFAIKRSMVNGSSIAVKTHVYTGYVVPILTFSSQSWYPNTKSQKQLEQVQKIATKWMVGAKDCYKTRLTKLGLLPISLYMELYDILYLGNILCGNVDIDQKCYITEMTNQTTRQDSRKEIIIPKARLQKTNDNFFIRAAKLMNVVRRALGINDNLIPNIQTISSFYWRYFQKAYNEMESCTWTILCNCNNCDAQVKSNNGLQV